jgi:hypothetical protein
MSTAPELSTRTAAPRPSAEEQAVIDWFGIYGERTDPPYAQWVCEKRVTYANEKDARTALNWLMRKRAVKGPIEQLEQRHHWCRQHEGFHLTSKKWGGR